jgi:hypothetical protein
MARRATKALAVGAALLGLWLGTHARLTGEPIHRNGFAGRKTAWQRDASSVRFEETAHDISDEFAHRPPTSEHITVNVQPPYHPEREPTVQYFYATPKAKISDELTATLWVRSSRPGIQLRARVVLPKERNPDQISEPMTVILKGETLTLTNHWQPLKLGPAVKLAKQEQQLMRARLNRDVDFTDAYVDRLILNLYTQPGLIDVYIDDLEIGPVESDRAPDAPEKSGVTIGTPTANDPGRPTARPDRAVPVELRREKLLVGGKPFFFRAIRPDETPLKTLRDAGFNTLIVDANAPNDLLDEAVNRHGFWLVPDLGSAVGEIGGSPQLTNNREKGMAPGVLTGGSASGELVARAVGRFPATDSVLFWELGHQRTVEGTGQLTRAADTVRQADPDRPLGADVFDGLRGYSNRLSMVGIHRYPLNTSLELTKYVNHLMLRHQLAQPGTFMYTAVQTHQPDWYSQLVYDKVPGPGFTEPTGPMPEQIRLLTYAGLAAGARGLVFSSDKFRGDSHDGRDRLLTLALLNQELQLLEPVLLTLNAAPKWIDVCTYDPAKPLQFQHALNPYIKAAVLRSERGVLVLPMWVGNGAQYVPGQSAAPAVSMIVPDVPDGDQAWLVSPSEVRSLSPNAPAPLTGTLMLQRSNRVVSGRQVIIPEFGLTAAVCFTSDTPGLVSYWQKQSRNMSRLAAEWSVQLAKIEIEKVQKVQEGLADLAPRPVDEAALMAKARELYAEADRALSAGDYRTAYQDANRCLRPLRILMRAEWDQAVGGMDTPVASQYALGYYTLPRHWRLVQEVRSSTAGRDLLGDGNFEPTPPPPGDLALVPVKNGIPVLPGHPGWTVEQVTLDDVELEASVVPEPDRPPPVVDPKKKFDAREVTRRGLPEKPMDGKFVLKLSITPKKTPLVGGKEPLPPAALDRTFLAVHSPVAKYAPGTLVRISAWVDVTDSLKATADGAMIYDSVGGEALAVRLADHTVTMKADKKSKNVWRHYCVYRRVPASGQIQVTVALTGMGVVYFDDIRIEPLGPAAEGASASAGPSAPTGPAGPAGPAR